MKFLQFTYVDVQTKRPLSEEYAPNGPTIPEGVVPLYDIQSSRSNQAPVVFGWTDNEDFVVESFMYEISEESFFSGYMSELKERAKQKRKTLLMNSLEFKGAHFSVNDVDKLNSLYSTMTAIKATGNIDFFAGTKSVELSKSEVKEVLTLLHTYSQKCFSWQKEFFDKVDELKLSIETLEEVIPLLEELNTFKVE